MHEVFIDTARLSENRQAAGGAPQSGPM